MSIGAGVVHDHGLTYEFASRAVTFFTNEEYLRQGDEWTRIDKPADAPPVNAPCSSGPSCTVYRPADSSSDPPSDTAVTRRSARSSVRPPASVTRCRSFPAGSAPVAPLRTSRSRKNALHPDPAGSLPAIASACTPG